MSTTRNNFSRSVPKPLPPTIVDSDIMPKARNNFALSSTPKPLPPLKFLCKSYGCGNVATSNWCGLCENSATYLFNELNYHQCPRCQSDKTTFDCSECGTKPCASPWCQTYVHGTKYCGFHKK